MRRQGVPLEASEAAASAVGAWWKRTTPRSTVLRLRSEFVRRPRFERWVPNEASLRTTMRDLIQHRGHAARLYLVALLDEQLLHPRSAKGWTAGPVKNREIWRDTLSSTGELRTPSWATLLLGYEDAPTTSKERRTAWQRSRYEATKNAFARLEAVELLDRETRVLLAEHRRWRWSQRIVDRRYRHPQRDEHTFTVPLWPFTTGLYLQMSGPALYTTLAAYEFDQLGDIPTVFDKFGLTWQMFDSADRELSQMRLPTEFRNVLAGLRDARNQHEHYYREGVITPRKPGATFPAMIRRNEIR